MTDEWSEWLLHRRHADDPEYQRVLSAETERYADRVLTSAQLAPGMRLLDVGTGDGLIAFRALEQVGPGLRVVLSDVSLPLLRHAQERARERGFANQCTFIHCAADDLRGVEDAGVDVVATRAVLAYVADKSAALRRFHRVLQPHGRISLAEPIFQDDALLASSLRQLLEAGTRSSDRVLPLLHRWKAAQFPDTQQKMAANPLTNYTERDLFTAAERAASPIFTSSCTSICFPVPSHRGTWYSEARAPMGSHAERRTRGAVQCRGTPAVRAHTAAPRRVGQGDDGDPDGLPERTQAGLITSCSRRRTKQYRGPDRPV